MEKNARASFLVLRVNRWVALALLGLALAAVILPAGLGGLFARRAAGRVQPGVTLGGADLSGMTEAQVRAFLSQIAPQFYHPPQDAQLSLQGVIPELAGRRLDLEATLLRAMTAPGGAAVEPAVTAAAPARTLRDFPHHPIYQGNPQKKAVSFIINVAWGEEHLLPMLEILGREKVLATFFITGAWAEKNAALMQAIVRGGHEVANHGYSDASPSQLSREELKAEIARASKVIESITSQKIAYYSPHKGEVNENVVQAAAELGYRTVLWSLDTIDWQNPSAETLLSRIVPRAKNGDLVLMHPTAVTRQALPALISGLRGRGFSLVTLSQILSPT